MYQLLTLLFFLLSCSNTTNTRLEDVEIVPQWFTNQGNLSTGPITSSVRVHPFFDPDSAIDVEKREFNFIPLFFKGSSVRYDFDFPTGSIYKKYDYCKHSDIRHKYTKILEKPSFSYGIIPRSFSVNKGAQNVLVFGIDQDVIDSYSIHQLRSLRVRLVGSVVLKECLKNNCSVKNQRKKYYPIAVSTIGKFSKINELSELKKEIDWDYSMAFFLNMFGEKNSKQYIFFEKEFSALPSLDLFNDLTIAREFNENVKLQNSCKILYKHIYNKIENIEKLKKDYFLDKKKNIASFTKSKFSLKEKNIQKKSDLLINRKFSDFMNHFNKKIKSRYELCSAFCPKDSHDRKKLRLFTYLDLYNWFERQGYVFSCRKEAWMNQDVLTTTIVNDIRKENIKYCSDRSYDRAMELAYTLSSARKASGKSFLYLALYDSDKGGTHQRIVGMIEDQTFSHQCSKKSLSKKIIVPNDLKWIRYYNDLY